MPENDFKDGFLRLIRSRTSSTEIWKEATTSLGELGAILIEIEDAGLRSRIFDAYSRVNRSHLKLLDHELVFVKAAAAIIEEVIPKTSDASLVKE